MVSSIKILPFVSLGYGPKPDAPKVIDFDATAPAEEEKKGEMRVKNPEAREGDPAVETVPEPPKAEIAPAKELKEEPKQPEQPKQIEESKKAAEDEEWTGMNENYLDPYFRFSVGTGKAKAATGVTDNSPEMESTLNGRLPLAKLNFGFGRPDRLVPKYDLFGKERPDDASEPPFVLSGHDKNADTYFLPNIELGLINNPSVAEKDYSVAADAGFSVLMHPKREALQKGEADLTLGLYFKYHFSYLDRQWPSLAVPSGMENTGKFGFNIDAHLAPSLEILLFAEGYRSSFTYDEENFGSKVNVDGYGTNVGGKIYFKRLAMASPFLPTVGAEGGISPYAKQDVPDVELGAVDEGKRMPNRFKWNAGGGLHWGKKLWNLSLGAKYSRSELDGFVPIWEERGTASIDIPYVGRLKGDIGKAKGGYHFYRIDTELFADAEYESPEELTPVIYEYKLPWGVEGTYARYKDMERADMPEYLAYGGSLFVRGEF